ncbi:MAG: FeoB-associated Cys-rich membrane protein [Ruminococcaceae bacterium]|jgi:hypothetical protein|nr:FeoB-associated Cys-rich membrane protein [Oscillospiraceae bacterium]
MATWIIGGIVIGAMALAIRYTWKKQKNGECAGGCSGCDHCAGHSHSPQ